MGNPKKNRNRIALGHGEYEGGGCNSGEIGAIKLAWDPNPDPNVAGYKVYWWLKKEIGNYP